MSTRVDVARKYIDAFRTLDGDLFTSLKTPDCLHHFAPSSLGIPAPKTNEEFSEHMKTLQDILKGFPVFIKELWDSDNHITIWATSETQFREEAMDNLLSQEQWAFKGEYIFILELNEAGNRISRIVEFLDSKATEELRSLAKRARSNLGMHEKHL